MHQRRFMTHFFAHLILGVGVLICLMPIIWIFTSSVNGSNQLIRSEFSFLPDRITLDHYKRILFDAPFLKWLMNSLILASTTTLVCITLSTTSAYAYSRLRFKGYKAGLMALLLINAFPNILSIVAYFKILSFLGLLDNRLGLILIYTGSQLSFMIWNLKGYFDTIPIAIEESARIDGASTGKIFTSIILPLSKPAIAVTAMLGFMIGWNEYILAMTFLLSPDKFSVSVGIWTLQQSGAYAMNWPLFSAGSLLVALPVAVMFLSLQKNFVHGLTVGGVKG